METLSSRRPNDARKHTRVISELRESWSIPRTNGTRRREERKVGKIERRLHGSPFHEFALNEGPDLLPRQNFPTTFNAVPCSFGTSRKRIFCFKPLKILLRAFVLLKIQIHTIDLAQSWSLEESCDIPLPLASLIRVRDLEQTNSNVPTNGIRFASLNEMARRLSSLFKRERRKHRDAVEQYLLAFTRIPFPSPKGKTRSKAGSSRTKKRDRTRVNDHSTKHNRTKDSSLRSLRRRSSRRSS